MYPSYPAHDPQPETARSAPATIRAAVTVMYAGAAASLLAMAADLATIGATKSAIAHRFSNLSTSQLDAQQLPLTVGWIVGGLIGAAAWILIARNTRAGRNWAAITGTVLFGVATIDAVAGLVAPEATLARVVFLLVWLVGLVAVVLLWRRDSRAYLRSPRS